MEFEKLFCFYCTQNGVFSDAPRELSIFVDKVARETRKVMLQ